MSIKCARLVFFMLLVSTAHAEQQLITAGVSLQEYWDDNFSRTRDGVREQITLTSASVALDKKLSRQQVSVRWKGTENRHEFRDELDARIHVGEATWDGQWGEKWRTEFSVVRDAYAVDRLEFIDKDVVAKNDAIAKVGYGSGERLVIYLGARHTKQYHSAMVREGLDYDEDEMFVEAQYQTAHESSFALRYSNGERQYPRVVAVADVADVTRDIEPGDLDFDYQQLELQSTTQLSPKTQFNSQVAYFSRAGVVNDERGALAALDMVWAPREKLTLKVGYLLKQPAVGDFSDSPSDIDRVFLSSEWQITHKILLSMNAYYEEQAYDGVLSAERKEQVSVIAPVNITFNYSENISLRIHSEWEDRESLLSYRDYTSLQGRLGIFVSF